MNSITSTPPLNDGNLVSLANPLHKFSSQSNSGPFPTCLPQKLDLVLDQTGRPFSIQWDRLNSYVLPVGSKALNSIIRDEGLSAGISLNKQKLSELNESLEASAEKANQVKNVWKRVAQIDDGIEIDVGDLHHTRVRVRPNLVQVVRSGSHTLFYRPQYSRPMVLPAEIGDLSRLKKFVNVDSVSFLLVTAWLSYTLAHPKVSTSKFVILAVLGGKALESRSLLS